MASKTEIQLEDKAIPKHVGIILDGNRRFAKRLMMNPWKGHEWGVKKFEKLVDWCKELGVRELTLYIFSLENLNRPKEEIDYLMDLFRKEFERIKNDKRISEYGVRISFIGKLDVFPEDVQEKVRELMRLTEKNNNYMINFAFGYSGREEILHAVRDIAEKAAKGELDPGEIDEELFSDSTYLKSQPDMIIRTGGEKRLSNFLTWQSPYAELFFLDVMWPEFEKQHFVECIKEFGSRQRRFGK